MDYQIPAEKPKSSDTRAASESVQSLNSVDILIAQAPTNSARASDRKAPTCFDDLTPQGKKTITDAYRNAHKEGPIGDVCMDREETIHMRLRRAGTTHADALDTYKKGREFYKDILKHLGGLKPGEVKLVAPWPDDFGTRETTPKKAPQDLPKGGTPEKRRGG